MTQITEFDSAIIALALVILLVAVLNMVMTAATVREIRNVEESIEEMQVVNEERFTDLERRVTIIEETLQDER